MRCDTERYGHATRTSHPGTQRAALHTIQPPAAPKPQQLVVLRGANDEESLFSSEKIGKAAFIMIPFAWGVVDWASPAVVRRRAGSVSRMRLLSALHAHAKDDDPRRRRHSACRARIKRPIRIAPGLEVTVLEADEGKPGGVHTGTVTWSGGRALAGYLSENAHLVRGKRVAEIGCRLRPRLADVLRPRGGRGARHGRRGDALARVAGAPGGAQVSTALFDIFGDAPLPPCDVLVASDVGYTEKLALGFARRAAEAIAAGATVVTSDSTKLRWTEFLAEASRLTGRDVRAFSWRDKSNPYVRPASVAVLRPFRIGSRPSKLAIVQAERVRSALNVSAAIMPIDAAGDIQGSTEDAPLARKGVDFTGSLDDALLDGTIDAAVHSCKDIPPQNRWRAGLTIAACLPRADVQDVLVGPYASLQDLPAGTATA